MNRLYKILAEIIVDGDIRTTSFHNGYRPGFKFFNNMQTSGSIQILDNNKEVKPNKKTVVEVSFISNQLLGDIEIGTPFKFYEGNVQIGNGRIVEVIGWA